MRRLISQKSIRTLSRGTHVYRLNIKVSVNHGTTPLKSLKDKIQAAKLKKRQQLTRPARFHHHKAFLPTLRAEKEFRHLFQSASRKGLHWFQQTRCSWFSNVLCDLRLYLICCGNKRRANIDADGWGVLPDTRPLICYHVTKTSR